MLRKDCVGGRAIYQLWYSYTQVKNNKTSKAKLMKEKDQGKNNLFLLDEDGKTMENIITKLATPFLSNEVEFEDSRIRVLCRMRSTI